MCNVELFVIVGKVNNVWSLWHQCSLPHSNWMSSLMDLMTSLSLWKSNVMSVYAWR